MAHVNVYPTDNGIRVHGSECSHVVRDWRQFGRPVVLDVESITGLFRELRSLGIRVNPESARFLSCVSLADGFWSVAPDGSPLRKLPTAKGARIATARIANRHAREIAEKRMQCEGHYDDDRALMLGGMYYCDGSCV